MSWSKENNEQNLTHLSVKMTKTASGQNHHTIKVIHHTLISFVSLLKPYVSFLGLFPLLSRTNFGKIPLDSFKIL